MVMTSVDSLNPYEAEVRTETTTSDVGKAGGLLIEQDFDQT